MNQRITPPKKNNVYLILFMYWLILLIWQNVRSAANRDSIDTIIKACLIVFLTVYFVMRSKTVKSSVLIVFLVYILLISVTKLTASSFQLADAMYYYFPFLMFLVTMGFGGNSTISKDDVVKLFYMLTFTVLYIVIYSWIFQTDKYLHAFSVTNAYGNELTSFLASSHEFGYYLAFGIMGAILCNDLDAKMNSLRRTYLIFVIVLFSVSLILTFSRTAILAFVSMLLWYVFSSGQRGLKRALLIVVLLIAFAIIVIKPLREYVLQVVFKNNNDAGRDDLAISGLSIFKSAPLMNRFFGYDMHTVRRYLVNQYSLSSFHNAYIQTLVCNGITGVAFQVGCFIYEAIHIARTMRISPGWRRLSNLFFSFEVALLLSMMFQTNSLFASSIDSYFLTMFGFLLPIYADNAIMTDAFGAPQEVEKVAAVNENSSKTTEDDTADS